MKIAIVGAGITASLLSKWLTASNYELTVFEKSRGCGGRASTKRTDWGQCDLGATIVPAKTNEFNQHMQLLCEQGLASPWPQKIYSVKHQAGAFEAINTFVTDRQYYIFKHKMNAACQYWLAGSKLCTSSLVTQVRRTKAQKWQLKVNDLWLEQYFDKIVLTAPWPQTQQIIEDSDISITLPEQTQDWMSCWSVGIKIEQKIASPVDLLYLKGAALQTLVRDSHKPHRPQVMPEKSAGESEIWVSQLTNELSASLGKEGKQQAIDLANDTLKDLFAVPGLKISQNVAHFWRFARPAAGQTPLGIVSEPNIGFYAGGDWSFGASIEASYEAAKSLEQSIFTK